MSKRPERAGRKPSIFLFMAFMIAMVAMCGSLVYIASLGAYSRMETRRAAAEADRLHAIIVSSVQAVLREPETSLETAAYFMALDRDHAQTVLGSARESSRYFTALLELDAGGTVVREDSALAATADSGSPYRGADFSSTPFMEALRSSAGVRWSSIQASLDEGRREIYCGLRTETGYLMGIMDFGALADRLSELLGENAAGLSLTDQSGTFIVNRDMDKVDRREVELDFLAARLAAPGGTIYRYVKTDGDDRFDAVARRIPGVGWFAIVERPSGYAREALWQSLPLVSTLSLLSIGLAGGLAGAAMRRLYLDVKAAGTEAGKPGSAGSAGLFFRETDSIMTAARNAAMRLRAEEEANERLVGLNMRLEAALDELSKAQAALVASEREALQGAMSAALAHELNTPMAAGVSAASMAEAAAGDLLAFLADYPCADDTVGAFARGLGSLAEAYEPESMPNGLARREGTRRLRDRLKDLLGEGYSPAGGSGIPSLAGRLVDLGALSSGGGIVDSLAAALLAGNAGPALACLSAAEIAASARVILSAMAAAHSVVGSLGEYSVPETLGGTRPIRLAASVESAVALLYTHTRRGIELSLELDGDPWIEADPGAVKRIWLGMIAQSLETIAYRGRVGIGVAAEAGRAKVRFSLAPESGRPAMGGGERDGGTPGGMDLASIGRLVEMSGGKLTASAEEGFLHYIIEFPVRGPGGTTGAVT